ncbi:MAG: hypothetical protein U0802_04655 [Candidatus Binatia bacterium]
MKPLLAAASIVCLATAAPALPPVRVVPLRGATNAAAPVDVAAPVDARAVALAARLRRLAPRLDAPPAARAALAALRAEVDDLRVSWRADAGTPRQIRGGVLQPALRIGQGDAADTARAFLRAHRGLMRLDAPDDELQLERRERDALGRTRLRFAQRYQGLPVWPAGLIVHVDAAGAVDLVDGAYVPTRAASPRRRRSRRRRRWRAPAPPFPPPPRRRRRPEADRVRPERSPAAFGVDAGAGAGAERALARGHRRRRRRRADALQ